MFFIKNNILLKNKIILLIFLFIFFVFSCGEKENSENKNSKIISSNEKDAGRFKLKFPKKKKKKVKLLKSSKNKNLNLDQKIQNATTIKELDNLEIQANRLHNPNKRLELIKKIETKKNSILINKNISNKKDIVKTNSTTINHFKELENDISIAKINTFNDLKDLKKIKNKVKVLLKDSQKKEILLRKISTQMRNCEENIIKENVSIYKKYRILYNKNKNKIEVEHKLEDLEAKDKLRDIKEKIELEVKFFEHKTTRREMYALIEGVNRIIYEEKESNINNVLEEINKSNIYFENHIQKFSNDISNLKKSKSLLKSTIQFSKKIQDPVLEKIISLLLTHSQILIRDHKNEVKNIFKKLKLNNQKADQIKRKKIVHIDPNDIYYWIEDKNDRKNSLLQSIDNTLKKVDVPQTDTSKLPSDKLFIVIYLYLMEYEILKEDIKFFFDNLDDRVKGPSAINLKQKFKDFESQMNSKILELFKLSI